MSVPRLTYTYHVLLLWNTDYTKKRSEAKHDWSELNYLNFDCLLTTSHNCALPSPPHAASALALMSTSPCSFQPCHSDFVLLPCTPPNCDVPTGSHTRSVGTNSVSGISSAGCSVPSGASTSSKELTRGNQSTYRGCPLGQGQTYKQVYKLRELGVENRCCCDTRLLILLPSFWTYVVMVQTHLCVYSEQDSESIGTRKWHCCHTIGWLMLKCEKNWRDWARCWAETDMSLNRYKVKWRSGNLGLRYEMEEA